MTRDEMARLLRHHRRRYGSEFTRFIYGMLRSGELNPRLYWASFDETS